MTTAELAQRATRARHALAVAAPELATTAVLLAGWALVTDAIAALLPHAPVWRVSAGLFCLSLFGWGLLWEIARKGLYALSLEGKRHG